jgi:hypothetical protein
MQTPVKNLTLSALFIALGVLIPILFHGFGLGSVFLPMFWPVAACPFFVPVSYAVAVGALTPFVSTLLTGMPPLSPPVLPMMVVELIVLAGATGWFYRKTALGIFWVLLIGLLVSRVINFFIAAALAPILGLPSIWVAVAFSAKGFPGITVMLVCVPIFVNRFKKESIFKYRIRNVKNAS